MNWDKARARDRLRSVPQPQSRRIRPFPARYPSACAVCPEPIKVGDLIRSWDHQSRRYAHVACVNALADGDSRALPGGQDPGAEETLHRRKGTA